MSSVPSSSPSVSASPLPPPDGEILDLGTLLAPMRREELELMLVKIISKHPAEVNWILQAARKPVDTLEISNDVATECSTGTSISGVLSELDPHLTRALDYLKGQHVRNAAAILEALTPGLAEWTAEQGPLDEMETEDKAAVETFFANMETCWQSVIEQCRIVPAAAGSAPTGVAAKTALTRTSGAEKQAKQRAGRLGITDLAANEVDFYVQLLNEAKKKLTPSVGPMFSDPLRMLNKKKASAAQAASAAAAAANAPAAAAASSTDATAAAPFASAAASSDAAPAAASSAPVAGAKRKASDADAADEAAAPAAAAPKPAAAKPPVKGTNCTVVVAPPKKKAKQ